MTTNAENAMKIADERHEEHMLSGRQGSKSEREYNESCGCTGGGHGYLMLIVAVLFVLYAVATILI